MTASILHKIVPAPTRRTLRLYWNDFRHKYRRLMCSFAPQDLLAGIQRCGIQPGDSVLVHSSFSEFQGFRGTPLDVITVLEEAVGSEGVLLMPTHSFEGVAAEYAIHPKVFNPLTSPSFVGILPEVFRRKKDVHRSLHPTHSVAAWGHRACSFLDQHHMASSPCGRGTPYHRLYEADGKILMIDVPVILTFYHCVEEILEPLFPVSPFTRETYRLPIQSEQGLIYSAPMRLYDPLVSQQRWVDPLVKALKKAGCWKETKVANVGLVAVKARDVAKTTEKLARRRIFCYRGWSEMGDRIALHAAARGFFVP
jgi:aminoglycoside 3-N-acetyltransferase